MKDFKKIFSSRLTAKGINGVGRGAFVNSIFNTFCKDNFKMSMEVHGKIENNIYVVKLTNSSFKSVIFLQKKKVLDHINLKLKDMNFDEILDIKVV